MAKTLPWEIIVDILFRLSVKDLLRYRCVSKQWRFLIDSPDFIKIHLNHSKEANFNLAAILFSYNRPFWVDLDALNTAVELNHPIAGDDEIEIIGSCNGLLALTDWVRDVVLWNPSTRRYRKLPISNILNPFQGFIDNCSLCGFGHIDNCSLCGFGHDPVNDDYKLVMTTMDSVINVYSAKSNAWKSTKRELPFIFDPEEGPLASCGVFAGSALHWVVLSEGADCFAFDLVTEEYREFPLPGFKNIANENAAIRLEVLGGSLCLVCNHLESPFPLTDFSFRRLDVWVMKEYGVKESWTKLFTVKLSLTQSIDSRVAMNVVAYPKSCEQIILYQQCVGFVLYDVQRKSHMKVQISGLPRCFTAHSCVGSMVGLDGAWDKVEENNE